MNNHSYERSFMKGTFMNDSLQEQLIAARRNQILDAATKVFAEKGFHLPWRKGTFNAGQNDTSSSLLISA